MSDALTTAITAGIVSLVITVITQFVLRRIEEQKIRQVNSSKLVEIRLTCYPMAFDITDAIEQRKAPEGTLSREELKEIQRKLKEWKKGTVSLVISQKSLKAFYDLRSALSAHYGEQDKYSEVQIEKLFLLKKAFRGCLRTDLGLLFRDEEDK